MQEKLFLILLDVVVLSALAGTIYYLRIVLNSIQVIRQGRTELQKILQELNIHISNAQGSIEGMKNVADSKAKTLQKQVDSASAVIEELQYIQKAADNVAQRLEKLTQQGATPMKGADDAPVPTGRSKAEQQLADVLASRRQRSGE